MYVVVLGILVVVVALYHVRMFVLLANKNVLDITPSGLSQPCRVTACARHGSHGRLQYVWSPRVAQQRSPSRERLPSAVHETRLSGTRGSTRYASRLRGRGADAGLEALGRLILRGMRCVRCTAYRMGMPFSAASIAY